MQPDSFVGLIVDGVEVGGSNGIPVEVTAGGGGAVTVADGADVALGAVADAAVVTNAVGTISGKLRGLVAHLVTLLTRVPNVQGTLTDRSGSTSGTPSTSTQVMAANEDRRYLLFQNISDTDMWVNFTSAAAASTAGSYLVPANGGSLEMGEAFITTQALNVLCTAATKAYTCKEG